MQETNRIEYKARLTKDLDLVEQLGSGIPRILESYGKECFQFSNNFLRMVFPSAEQVDEERELADGLVDGLADTRKKILMLVHQNPKISKREMSEVIGVSSTAIDNNLRFLKEENILERIGNNKSGYWKIKAKK